MKIQIENLKALMRGRTVSIYQQADAIVEFNKLVAYTEELEQFNLDIVSNSLPFDKVDLLLKMQIEEVRKHVDTQARDEGAVRADFDKWIRESPVLTMHRQ